jgi:hypothetical protein
MPLPLGTIYSIAKDIFGWLVRKLRKPDQIQLIEYRNKIKKMVESNLPELKTEYDYGEVIVRDIKRMDDYPEVDDKLRGISPWFKLGLIGTYHRGIKVGLGYEGFLFDKKNEKWRKVNYDQGEEKEINLLLVGYIPFDRIKNIDWVGDEYYIMPHLYCDFTGPKKQPYEKLIYCMKIQFGTSFPAFKEIIDLDELNNTT